MLFHFIFYISDDIAFAGAIAARCDRVNNGLNPSEMTHVIQEMRPELSRQQASRQVSRRVLPENARKGVLKPHKVKAQPTTTDRTAITWNQQYRWHLLISSELDFLRKNNTGTCPVTGKTFGELIDHFVIGLDEMCIMANHDGSVSILAAADVKKQEKILQDRCVHIFSGASIHSFCDLCTAYITVHALTPTSPSFPPFLVVYFFAAV